MLSTQDYIDLLWLCIKFFYIAVAVGFFMLMLLGNLDDFLKKQKDKKPIIKLFAFILVIIISAIWPISGIYLLIKCKKTTKKIETENLSD